MVNQVRCADLMPGSGRGFVVEGSDAVEVITAAAEHARNDYGIVAILPENTAGLHAAVEGTRSGRRRCEEERR